MGKINFDELSASLADNIKNKAEKTAVQTLTTNLEGVKNKIEEHVLNHPSTGPEISVVDNLITSDPLSALSANQGKILNDKYISLISADSELSAYISQINTKIQTNTNSISNKADSSTVSALSSKVDTVVSKQGELTLLNTNDKSSIVSAINEVFTNVSNGKSLLASAITDKGVSTLATDSFETMKNNILSISGGNSEEIQSDYMTFSDKNLKVIHTLKSKTKNLSIKSQSICGRRDSEGKYNIKYMVDNGVASNDRRFKRYYKDIKLPYPLYGNTDKQNELRQKEDGSFEFVRRCTITGEADQWQPFLPTGRYGLRSHQYNGKIYCIGGYLKNSGGYTAVNEIYDITTNTWTVGSPMPTARSLFSSVLHNGKIYCFGGRTNATSSLYINKLQIYDIESDTWTTGADSAITRENMGTVVYNDKIYIIGGNNSNTTDIVEVYDIASDSWSFVNNMPVKKTDFGCVEHNGKIYCVAGKNSQLYNNINMYDIESNTWTTIDSVMNQSRYSCQCVLYNSKIYCIGGYQNNTYKYINELEVYDIESNSWYSCNSIPNAPMAFSTVLYNDNIYCIGGSGLSDDYYNKIQIYDLLNDNWNSIKNVPVNRYNAICQLYNNKIYYISGNISTSNYNNTTDVLDLETNTWIQKTPIPSPRTNATCQLYNGKIYCIGGKNSSGYLNTIDIYDIESDTWSAGTNMPTVREGLSSVIYNGKIYCVGGYYDKYHDTIEVYDIESDSWSTISTPMINGRTEMTVQLYNGKIYCIGGRRYSSCCKTIEIYDIELDKWSTGANIPTPRIQFSSVLYNGKIYCFGGNNSNSSNKIIYNKVEVYDIESDSWLTLKDMPETRDRFTCILYDGVVYCIGGLPYSIDTYKILNIDSFEEEIIALEEDYSFDTYNHVTSINCLENINPTITADFEVEI